MSAPAEPGPVGLVVALPAEARSLGARGIAAGDCVAWHGGWIAVSGVGPHDAVRAAEQLVAHGVARLANWGVAGALDPELLPGDVVVPARVLYSAGDDGYATDPAGSGWLAERLANGLRVRRGTLWSAHQAVATRQAKHELGARSGACAVDMEAAPIAALARHAGLPFVALKVICDSASRDLPARIADTLRQGDQGMTPRMLAAIALGGPSTWRATRRLARDFAAARASLAAAARLADPVAPPP